MIADGGKSIPGAGTEITQTHKWLGTVFLDFDTCRGGLARDKDFVLGHLTVTNDDWRLLFQRAHSACALHSDPTARTGIVKSTFSAWIDGQFTRAE